MAIKFTKGQDSITLSIDNGDLKALNIAEEKWNFKDKESLFKFMMAILIKSDPGQILIKEDSEEVSLSPADSLLKQI